VTAYRELLARLVPARRFGIVLGLERMRALLDRLGAPDARLGTIVHVAGTNGKGSTVAMLAALVAAAGRRVATYTSPHLSCLRERIAISGAAGLAAIGEDEIVAAADRVRAAGGDELTFFEQLTAIAAVAIGDAGVDVTILEVGLGGRLDATNAIAANVAVVTGVALDHEAILGGTIEQIAREKAGIFKPGQRIVIGASGEPAALPVLRDAARVGAVVSEIDGVAIASVPPLPLAGDHQRANAAAALAAFDHLEALAVVSGCDRARALATVRHPGRLELAGDVLLDGAHNPAGARALAAALGSPRILIVAVSSDKDVAAFATALAPVARVVIATRYQQERALAPEAVAAAFAAHGVPVETAPDLARALLAARRHAPPGTEGAIVVCGSLLVIGEARVLLLGAPADPIALSDPASAR
jgi:dihydrofolate synthase / folylpolyglutamate synthase